MARAPQIGIEKRRFENVSPELHGAVILDADNKAKGVAVQPGETIWLSLQEEQLTAEAPVRPEDNPFVKEWQRPTESDAHGNPTAFSTETGVLRPTDEAPRVVGSQRFTPSHGEPEPQDAAPEAEEAEEDPGEVTGAAPAPQEEAAQGQAAPDEEVATPSAVAANDEALAARRKAAEPETTVDAAGIEWEEGAPKGAPEADSPRARKPVAG